MDTDLVKKVIATKISDTTGKMMKSRAMLSEIYKIMHDSLNDHSIGEDRTLTVFDDKLQDLDNEIMKHISSRIESQMVESDYAEI